MLTVEEITEKLRKYKQLCEKGAIREWEICSSTNRSGKLKCTIDIKLGSYIKFGSGFLNGLVHDLGASGYIIRVENNQLYVHYIIEE